MKCKQENTIIKFHMYGKTKQFLLFQDPVQLIESNICRIFTSIMPCGALLEQSLMLTRTRRDEEVKKASTLLKNPKVLCMILRYQNRTIKAGEGEQL